VATDRAAFVEDPAGDGGVLVLEAAQELRHGGAADLELGAAAGELAERSVNADESQGDRILRPEAAREIIGRAVLVDNTAGLVERRKPTQRFSTRL
jgi:hypothetical protein